MNKKHQDFKINNDTKIQIDKQGVRIKDSVDEIYLENDELKAIYELVFPDKKENGLEAKPL